MTFNSFLFWLFFAAVWAVYWRLPHRAQNRLLLLASYVFYGCWDWRFLGLIVFTTCCDFLLARRMAACTSPRPRRLWLTASIVINLSILGFFKYYGFFARELAALLTGVGLTPLLPTLDVVLPVGISFYTFQTMSYTIDVYRGRVRPAANLLDFALYIAFFPQLVAGPIERAETLLPQVLQPRRWHGDSFARGLYFVAYGLFQKVVVADNMAVLVNTVFRTPPSALSSLEVALGIYAFAFQIYGDFAGYSSIARGVAQWLGFELMSNFERPYLALDPSDFWRRWHISLSQWLRDYLYIPLGGNRGGAWLTYRNLLLTMLLGGLWHGANWTFLAWGAFHGLLLCGFRLFGRRREGMALAPRQRLLQMVVMFHGVCLGWLFFRADSLPLALSLLGQLLTPPTVTPLATTILGTMLFCVGPLMAYEVWVESQREPLPLLNAHWLPRGLAYAYVALMCLLIPPPVAATFIYFQF
uniref:MBOAT family protein n=1 Tax=Schlesneria paludicola TaxID=360056 RepID=A0A7C4LKE6_9PLAN